MPAGTTAISRDQMVIMVKYAIASQGRDGEELGAVSRTSIAQLDYANENRICTINLSFKTRTSTVAKAI